MCFSAGASFSAGILLTFAGAETLRKVHKPSQIVFAGIPLFFAVQQITEGVVWVSIPRQYFLLQNIATYVYLTMALIIWPLLVPLSVLLMEKNKPRKKILMALQGVGVLVAIHYMYSLLFYRAYAEISFMHINYKSDFHSPIPPIGMLLYLAATIAPVFISTVKRTNILGIIISVSFLISIIFFTRYLTSVWCFFAAVISFVIYYIIRDEHRKFHFKV